MPLGRVLGNPIRPELLLYDTEHSLVEQSRKDRLAGGNPNADGLGLGWYGGRDEPGLYRSIAPAWGDRNLRELSQQIESPLFLAHIRAATGTPIEQTNCHPFRHGRWLFSIPATSASSSSPTRRARSSPSRSATFRASGTRYRPARR